MAHEALITQGYQPHLMRQLSCREDPLLTGLYNQPGHMPGCGPTYRWPFAVDFDDLVTELAAPAGRAGKVEGRMSTTSMKGRSL